MMGFVVDYYTFPLKLKSYLNVNKISHTFSQHFNFLTILDNFRRILFAVYFSKKKTNTLCENY